MNLASVCGGMMVVEPENATKQPISPSVKPAYTSQHGLEDVMLDHHRAPLLLIRGRLIMDRYVIKVVAPVVLPLLQDAPNTVFQQDNARLLISPRALSNLTAFDILPWHANSPDLNPIKHLLIGCDMNLGVLPQTVIVCAQQCTWLGNGNLKQPSIY
ncbi:hypothetical protein TNCV_4387911 [Trichonephila clavipes]|nr:hypothetical protein TNCV_4387911 [Trichonephila clavipes]